MRLAVIGLGKRLGHLLNNIFRTEIPDLRVVGVIDPDQVSATSKLTTEEQSTAVFCTSVRELLKTKPDAIAIGTRCNMHAQYAAEVLPHNIPLFLEKPVAVSLKQARMLEKAAGRSRARTVVSFPLRLTPLCQHARRLIESGACGSAEHLLGVNYVSYGNVYFDSWYKDYRVTQGLFLQKATHDFDYLSYLAGAPIVRVAAMLSQNRVYKDMSLRKNARDKSALYYKDIGTPGSGMNEDSSSALLEFANGAQGVYTQVFYTRRDAAARGATISGHRGTISFDWYQRQLKFVRHGEPLTDLVTVDAGVAHFGGDQALVRNFAEVVQRGAVSQAPLTAGLQSVYACLAARASAEQGKFMSVQQLGG